jgi:hypothetical protein
MSFVEGPKQPRWTTVWDACEEVHFDVGEEIWLYEAMGMLCSDLID